MPLVQDSQRNAWRKDALENGFKTAGAYTSTGSLVALIIVFVLGLLCYYVTTNKSWLMFHPFAMQGLMLCGVLFVGLGFYKFSYWAARKWDESEWEKL